MVDRFRSDQPQFNLIVMETKPLNIPIAWAGVEFGVKPGRLDCRRSDR